MRPDPGHEATEEMLARLEREIYIVYQQAAREVQEKLDDYFRRFAKKDETWRRWVKEGKKTEAEYRKWREGQLMVGERWQAMQEQLAKEFHEANLTARKLVEVTKPSVFAENHNYGAYEVEMGVGEKVGFTLYDRSTVVRILRDQPDLLNPRIGKRTQSELDKALAAGKDLKWQKKQFNAVMLQGILQGESIPNLSKRIADTLGEVNHKSTIRYARTAVTSAQNAGRMDAYRQAEDMGIDMQVEWRATLDMRTRHEHRLLDGQVRAVDEPFEVGGDTIRYPGDPEAPGYLIWNCRCTTKALVGGWVSMSAKGRSTEALPDGMSYDDWKASHVEESHSITKQEEIAEKMRWKYINEYRRT